MNMTKKKLSEALASAANTETFVENMIPHLEKSIEASFNALANISPQHAISALESLIGNKKMLKQQIKERKKSLKKISNLIHSKMVIEDLNQ